MNTRWELPAWLPRGQILTSVWENIFYPGGESGLMIKNLSITLGMLTNKTAVVVVAQQKRK